MKIVMSPALLLMHKEEPYAVVPAIPIFMPEGKTVFDIGQLKEIVKEMEKMENGRR